MHGFVLMNFPRCVTWDSRKSEEEVEYIFLWSLHLLVRQTGWGVA